MGGPVPHRRRDRARLLCRRVPGPLPPRQVPACVEARHRCYLPARAQRSDEMTHDVVARLAAANPVPTGEPFNPPEAVGVRPRRLAVAVAVIAAVAIPATAVAGKLGDLLGISNDGTPVQTSSIFPGEPKLDAAL